MNPIADRKRFEAWARQRWTHPEDFDQRIKAPSKYNNYEVQAAWDAWQERAAQPAPSVPVAALRPVIQWLRNGCDPAKAADELEMLAAAPGSSRDDQHAGGLKVLNHQGLMERARQNAKKEAGLIYPDDEARREEKEQELASEYYRQYTTPNP